MRFLLVLLALTLAAAAPASAAPDEWPRPPSYAEIVGFWTDDGDCTDVIEMHSDGTFTTADGARGNWALDGDRLTMSGPGGSITATVHFDDRDTITLVHTDGSTAQSTRCPGGGRFDPIAKPVSAI